MHCRDKLGRKNQKGMLEKVTRQPPRTTEGQDRAFQEPREPVSQLPEWDHQELVGGSVGSCHLGFRHFHKSTSRNVVVAHTAIMEPEVARMSLPGTPPLPSLTSILQICGVMEVASPAFPTSIFWGLDSGRVSCSLTKLTVEQSHSALLEEPPKWYA